MGGSSARIGRLRSEPRGFHHANGRVGFISVCTGAPGQAGNAWFPEAGPHPRQLSFLFLVLRHLGEISAVPCPPGPRNVLFYTTPDAGPAGTSLLNRLHATGGRDALLGQGSTLSVQPPLVSQCPTQKRKKTKRGLPPERLKNNKVCGRQLFQRRSTELNLQASLFSLILSHPRTALTPTEATFKHMVVLAECLSVCLGHSAVSPRIMQAVCSGVPDHAPPHPEGGQPRR